MQLFLLLLSDLIIILFLGLWTEQDSSEYWLNTKVEYKLSLFLKTTLAVRLEFYPGYFNQTAALHVLFSFINIDKELLTKKPFLTN